MRILVMGGAGFIGGYLVQRSVADGHDVNAKHTHADSSKAAELLSYESNRTIREGVTEFTEWYRANREWYEPLVLES